MRIIYLLIILRYSLNIETEIAMKTVFLFTDRDNKVPSFKIIKNKKRSIPNLTLYIECSPMLANNILTSTDSINYCIDNQYEGNSDDINSILSRIRIRLKTQEYSDLYWIKYIISETKNDSQKITYEFVQKLKLPNNIPIQLKDNKITYIKDKESYFEQEILSVNESYFCNANPNDFVLLFKDNNYPQWIKRNFKNNTLYLSGTIPANQEAQTTSFSVLDKSTGLTSELITINLASSFKSKNTQTKQIIIVITSLSTSVMLFVCLMMIFKGKKVDSENKTTDEDNSFNNSHILSHSIINWNNQLSSRYKENDKQKSSLRDITIKTSEDVLSGMCNTFEEIEEEQINEISLTDRVSTIERSEGDYLETERNSSSFLEEYKLNQ